MSELEYRLDELEGPDPTRDGYRPYKWERHFFNAMLTKYGTIDMAATDAGVTTEMVLDRANESTYFRDDLELVKNTIFGKIDHEMIRRALEPQEKIVYYKGKMIGVEYVYDNRHLQHVAACLMPHKWHLATRVEAGQEGDGTVNFKLELSPGAQDEVDESS